MMSIGIVSLLISVITYVLCLLIYGGTISEPKARSWIFLCIFAKALSWSPFLGLEYYDTLLEHLYHDVYF